MANMYKGNAPKKMQRLETLADRRWFNRHII